MNQLRSAVRLSAFVCALAFTTSEGFCETATVDNATKAQLKIATDHYESGVTAMDGEKYADALSEFKLSYDTVSSPNSRLMIGRVLVKLGKLVEAYRELDWTLKQAEELAISQKKYKRTVESAQKEIDDLKKQLAFVRITPGSKLTVQGTPVELRDWQTLVPVAPGNVTLEVSTSNGRTLSKTATLTAGDTSEFILDDLNATSIVATQVNSPPLARSAPANATTDKTLNRRTTGYVVGGVGLVGVGLFVGFGLMGTSSYGDVKKNCVAANCPESAVDDSGAKSLRQGIGYTGLGIGVLGLGIGTWLVLSGGPANPSTAIAVQPSGVQLSQRF